jgi:parvulin-like peptidyl-prolyl isomerase
MRRSLLPLLLLLPAACGRSKEDVVAQVGPMTITQAEFSRKLSEVGQGYENFVVTPSGRRQFLDVLIREKMLLAAAQDSGVASSEEFKEEMERLRAEQEERIKEGREYLMTRLWLEDLRKKGVLVVSEEEIRDYHRRHPNEVEMRHILLGTSAEAEALAKRARAGAPFAALAKEKSLDGSTAMDGGRMPSALFGEIIPDLEEIIFRMRPGEIGGPIKSKFGYHVMRKDGEKKISFEQASDRIARLLEKQKLDRYLQSIQEKFPVEVIDEQFK